MLLACLSTTVRKLAYFFLGIRILIDARMENGVIYSQACILTGKHGIYQLIAGTSESDYIVL